MVPISEESGKFGWMYVVLPITFGFGLTSSRLEHTNAVDVGFALCLVLVL